MMEIIATSSKHKSLSKTLFIVYSILIVIFYYSYGLLEYYRLHHSQALDSTIPFESLVFTFGTLFTALFWISLITLHTVYRNHMKVLIHYLLLNIALFVGMVIINVIISISTPLPMQPILVSLVLLSIDVILMWFRKREISQG